MTYTSIRQPTYREVEKLRLVLSTYQDGTGMLVQPYGRTLPGWRDFERAAALALGGEAQESKFIFDVLLDDPIRPGVRLGLSCKMRRELNRLDRDGRATLELSNSAGKFWDELKSKDIDQTNYKDNPLEVGISLIETVNEWHEAVSLKRAGAVDLAGSSYLALLWNSAGLYQLHQFSLDLPDPRHLRWHFPILRRRNAEVVARHLRGDDESGTLFEWYGESGGQLKYYPLVTTAVWSSERFRLEPLGKVEHGILAKAAAYFPVLWEELGRED